MSLSVYGESIICVYKRDIIKTEPVALFFYKQSTWQGTFTCFQKIKCHMKRISPVDSYIKRECRGLWWQSEGFQQYLEQPHPALQSVLASTGGCWHRDRVPWLCTFWGISAIVVGQVVTGHLWSTVASSAVTPSITPEDLIPSKTRTDNLEADSEGDWTSGHRVVWLYFIGNRALLQREGRPFPWSIHEIGNRDSLCERGFALDTAPVWQEAVTEKTWAPRGSDSHSSSCLPMTPELTPVGAFGISSPLPCNSVLCSRARNWW